MKEVKRDDWFFELEATYLASLKAAQAYFDEALEEFMNAKEGLEEAESELARIRAKYPPGYDGPWPYF